MRCYAHRHLCWTFIHDRRPYIEEANKLAQTYARVFKEMILVTPPDKPMQRAAKGTIMRKLVLKSYAEEIEAL